MASPIFGKSWLTLPRLQESSRHFCVHHPPRSPPLPASPPPVWSPVLEVCVSSSQLLHVSQLLSNQSASHPILPPRSFWYPSLPFILTASFLIWALSISPRLDGCRISSTWAACHSLSSLHSISVDCFRECLSSHLDLIMARSHEPPVAHL